jgi:hypothetical protein
MLDTVNLYHLQETPTADVLDRQHLQIKRQQQDLRSAINTGAGIGQLIACFWQLGLAHFGSLIWPTPRNVEG